MNYYSIIRLIPIGVGMLFLAVGASGCAVEEQQGECDEDDVECQASLGGEESIASSEEEWRRLGLRLRPDLWGRRFIGPRGNPWVVGRLGYRHRIPDRFTYGNLWGLGDWNNIGYWDGLGGIPMGAPFARGAFLAGVGCGGCGLDIYDSCGFDPCGDGYLINDSFRYSLTRPIFTGFGFGLGGMRRFGLGGLDGYPLRSWLW